MGGFVAVLNMIAWARSWGFVMGGVAGLCGAVLWGTYAAHAAPPTYDDCAALVKSDPEAALAQAVVWAEKGGGGAARHCRGIAQTALGQFDAAAEIFAALADDLEETAPAVAARLHAQAGDAWLRADNVAAALTALDKAIDQGPDDWGPLVNRARAHAEADNYVAALDDLNRAVKLAPLRDDVYVLRAAAHRHVGSFDLAAKDLMLALRLNPRNPDALVELGAVRLAHDDVAAAKDAFGTAILVAPDAPAAWLAREFLAALRQDHSSR